jgi:hypothetical protein
MFAGRILPLGLFLGLSIWISGFNNPVAAGILRIETQTGATVEGELLTVRVTATNKGTEPAQNVQVHIILLARNRHGPVKDRLDPGQADTFLFKETLKGIKKGRYPLTVLVDFHDANQYPFSAVSCTTFYWKEDANPDLLSLGNDITVGAAGELLFTIKNLGLEPRKVRSSLVLPKELSTHDPRIDLQIDPRAEKRVVFAIANFSALSGASYPVFCLFEYDSEDTHYTAVARALIKIKKGENWFRRTKLLWLGAAIMLGVILVALQFKRKGA